MNDILTKKINESLLNKYKKILIGCCCLYVLFIIAAISAVVIDILYVDIKLGKLFDIIMVINEVLCVIGALCIPWALTKVVNIRKKLSLEYEDIIISVNNSMEFMSRLLNNKTIESEIYGIIKIENFPDNSIETKKSIDGLNRVTVRRFTIVGDEKVLKRLKISNEKINYITEILCS